MKNLFTANGCWAGLLEAGGLREIEVESVSKMLACGTSTLGVRYYICGNGHCPHVRYLCNTCHCRACLSCGKKAADQWNAVQNSRLPDTAAIRRLTVKGLVNNAKRIAQLRFVRA